MKYRSCLPTTSFGTNFEGTETLLFLTLWAVWCIVNIKHITIVILSPEHPAENIKKFRQLRFVKSFWHWNSIVLNGDLRIWMIPASSEKIWGKYIYRKFTNIGTSELHWDISGLFLDDRDISGFLLLNSIIIHMTGHFL